MGKKSANKDFQKVKLKVGRTLKRSTAYTNTAFKAKRIKLAKSRVQQVLASSSSTCQGKTFEELVRMVEEPGHARLGAARTLGEMMVEDPGKAGPEAIEALLRLGLGGGPEEQRASLAVLQQVVGLLGAAGKVIGAHLGAGLVHHRSSVRRHSLAVLQLMVEGQSRILLASQPLTLISRLITHLEPPAFRPLEGLLVLAGGLPTDSSIHHFIPKAEPIATLEQWEPLLDKLALSLMNSGLQLVESNKLTSETAQSLLRFLYCWSRLMELSNHLGLLKKIQETFAANFEKFFLREFPYTSQVLKDSKNDAEVEQINVRMACIHVHLQAQNLEPQGLTKILAYLREVCNVTRPDDNLTQQLLVVLDYLAATLPRPNDLFKHFMKLLMMLYKNAPMNHQVRHTIFISLNQIIIEHFRKINTLHMVKVWVGAAPNKMAKLPPSKVESSLDSMLWLLRLPNQLFPEIQLTMQENLDRFLNMLLGVAQYGEKLQVGVVNLISLVPQLDKKALRRLLELRRHLSPRAINQLIYLLSKRMEVTLQQTRQHENLGILRDADIMLTDFLHFLMTFLTGYSHEERENFPKLSTDPDDSTVYSVPNIDMVKHLDSARTACMELNGLKDYGLPSRETMQNMVKQLVENILTMGVKLPVHSGLTLLSLLPHFPDILSPRLVRLAGDLLLNVVLDKSLQGAPLSLLLESVASIAPQLLFYIHSIMQSQAINLKKAKSILLAMTQLAYCGLLRSLEAKKLILQLLQMLKEQVPAIDQERDWWVDMESHLEMFCH